MSAETKLRADHLPESMEISKSLQEEIFSVQNKLQNAILEHQINVKRLKEDPDNPDILGQIQDIQVYIVSLGRCQKQIVQRLRKEVEASKAENANGSKVSIPSLLGLNNNNHITNNNETKHETAANGFETKSSKEDYEEIVRNGDVRRSPPQDNNCPKRRPSSVETISGEEDIVEMSMDENSNEKEEMQQEASQVQEESSEMQQEASDVQQEASQMQKKSSIIESPEQQTFLLTMGLITKSKCIELQNKRVERKRRSTANPHFVYSMLEQPSKRKRHSYLQSGNAPHTRQTTARMNGPSPPPNKTQPTKSISPPTQTITKALIPFQKSSTRPNILRNADSKIFGKSKIEDNQARSSASSAKSVQSIGNKAVHIPGLPASLTIERIGSDSIVCVSCRNPGSLTICKNCSSNYHVSCHIQSPAPPRICPKCALAMDEEEDVEKDEEMEIKGQMEGENKLQRYKKNEKLVATAYASGTIGKAREDSEVHKTVGGLHKADATQKKRTLSTVPIGINQLSASTILIPLTSTPVDKSEDDKFTSIVDTEQRQDTVPRNSHNLNQHARSSITDVQAEDKMSHSYQLPSSTTVQPEKLQSYFIVKKIAESAGKHDKSADGEAEDKNCSTVYNYKLPTSCTATLQPNIHSFVTNPLFYDRNTRKKQIKRTIPLHRITASKLSNSLLPIPNDYQLDRATLNGRKPWAKLTRGKLSINQPAARPATEILLSSYSDAESSGNEHLQHRPKSIGSAEESAASFDSRGKLAPRAGTLIHSLFSGHNKPYTITSRARESRGFGPNDRDYPLLRQHLCSGEYELVPREQSDGGKPAAVQFQRRALTKFFEHVKLEEAHLPAPFRTKLAHQDEVDDNDEIVQKGERDQQYDDAGAVTEAPLLTLCEAKQNRSADRFPWIAHDTVSRSSSEDNNAADRSPLNASDVASTHSDDLTDYEFARVNAQSSRTMTSRQSIECENDQPASGVSIKQQKDDGAPVATLHIAQSNLSELRNEVSVPDDKADTERQDLPSGRQSRSRSNSSSSSGHSDTPEQAMSNTNNFRDEFEILAMGIVSPREKEEEHELAMARETDVAPPLARHS